MDLEKIREIIGLPTSDDIKESLVIKELSRDEKIIPILLLLLDTERKRKNKSYRSINLDYYPREEEKTIRLNGFPQDLC